MLPFKKNMEYAHTYIEDLRKDIQNSNTGHIWGGGLKDWDRIRGLLLLNTFCVKMLPGTHTIFSKDF